MEELTQEEILRVLAEAREESRKEKEVIERREEIVDEIERLADEFIRLRNGEVTKNCDFCRNVRLVNFGRKANGRPPVAAKINGLWTPYNYCPKCGAKL